MSTAVGTNSTHSWKEQVNAFNSDEYLKDGKKIELPKDLETKLQKSFTSLFRGQCLVTGENLETKAKTEAKDVAKRLQHWADWINEELSNDDLTDADKQSFMDKFCNLSSDDLDQDTDGVIGRILAAVVSGDEQAFTEMFDDEGFGNHNLTSAQVTAIDKDRMTKFKEWREANGIQHSPSTAQVNALRRHFQEQQKSASEIQHMTLDEVAERQKQLDAQRLASKPA
ncbi:MAG: hypothetical protein U1E65_20300 [Myxococcota bacterium]